MEYSLNLGSDGRILSASVVLETADNYDNVVGELPEGDITDYKYLYNEYVYDPLPEEAEEEIQKPSQFDILESQVIYTAMMTNTLLEV